MVPTALAAKDPAAIFFDGAFYKSGETVWQGKVFASKACGRGRRVFIFRVRPGKDEKLGSTRAHKGSTNNFYPFSYSEPGAAPSGDFYAKVKPTDTCKGARSGVSHGPG